MPIDQEIQKVLKQPFGILVADNEITADLVQLHLSSTAKLISVGDTTTRRLLTLGFIPDISIIDCKEKRIYNKQPVKDLIENLEELEQKSKFDEGIKDRKNIRKVILLECINPAGSITDSAYKTIAKSVDSENIVVILVEGEEDLLAIPVFVMAANNSTVFYGQPDQGMVIVKINTSIRQHAITLLEKIKIVAT